MRPVYALVGAVVVALAVAIGALLALAGAGSPKAVLPVLTDADLHGTDLKPKATYGEKRQTFKVAPLSPSETAPAWTKELRRLHQWFQRSNDPARLSLTVDVYLWPPGREDLRRLQEPGLIPAGPWAGQVFRETQDPTERIGDRSWWFDRGPKEAPAATEWLAFVKGNASARLHMYELGEHRRDRSLLPEDRQLLIRLARALAGHIAAWQKAGSIMPPLTEEPPPPPPAPVAGDEVCPPEGIREGPPLRPSPPLERDRVKVPDSVREDAMERLTAVVQPPFLPGSPASLIFARRGSVIRFHFEREGLTPTVLDGRVGGPIAAYVEIAFSDRESFVEACQRVFRLPDDVMVDGREPGDLLLRTADDTLTVKGLTDSVWIVGKRLEDARERRFSVLHAQIKP